MTDRKGLLNEIALLTNLLGSESPGTGDDVRKAGNGVSSGYQKGSLTIKHGRFKVRNTTSTSLKPLSAAVVLSLINGGPSTTTTANTFKVPDTKRPETTNTPFVGFRLASDILKSNATSTTGKTSKYRVDRRVRKNSKTRATDNMSTNTLRRNSGSNLLSPLSSVQNNRAKRNQLTSPLRKYSIRKYSIRRLKSSTPAPTPTPTSVLQENNVSGSYLNVQGKGSQVVRIDGTKYLSKNTGKSLQRIRTSSARSSDFQFQCLSKYKTPTHRSANRVLQRSITTLQGGKGGNRVCYFLKKFGICKRKENSTCPFFHGLSTPTYSNLKKSPLKSVKCRFFRKGQCLRPKCPYLHEKDTIRRSEENWKPQWQQRVKLARKGASYRSVNSKKRRRKLSEVEEEAIKARYFQSEPEVNPLSTIIKRRLPKGVEIEAVEEPANKPVTPDPVPVPIDNSKLSIDCDTNMVQEINVVENVQTVSSNASVSVDRETKPTNDRRKRLLGKLVTFKERVGRGSSDMPAFLPF